MDLSVLLETKIGSSPLRRPQEKSNLLVQSTSVLETQFSFKADVKGHLNYQNEEATSELSHGTIQQCSIVQASNSVLGSVSHRLPFHLEDDKSRRIHLAFCCCLCLTDSHASSTEGGLARLAGLTHGELRGAIARRNTDCSLIHLMRRRTDTLSSHCL